MSDIVDTSKELDVVQLFTSRLMERALAGEHQLTPDDVIFLIDDICIDARCTRKELPSAVLHIYHDAQTRRDNPSFRSCNFTINHLARDLERALQPV